MEGKESKMAPTSRIAFLALSFLLSGHFAAAGKQMKIAPEMNNH
jgi:hypothetical protein